MAVWVCSQCGYETESRCKPRKCPECSGGQFNKKEGGAASPAADSSKAAPKKK